jgi:hypothetical protein
MNRAQAGIRQYDEHERPDFHRSAEVNTAFAVTVERAGTANGGYEWHLCVGGERVPLSPPSDLGVFTDPDVTPAQALVLLLARASR